MSTADDWLYSDDLDVGLPDRDHLASPVSRDGEDLLDDVLTAPSNSMSKIHDLANEDEMLDMDNIKTETAAMEDSGSARFNADQVAKKAQLRMEIMANGGRSIYSREPNRKNSIFIGNLTWWTSDEDVIMAVREGGLKDVVCIKFYETRANGQSKGFALVELSSESLATNAQAKLEALTIHNQKPIVSYAFRISPHQFEGKCNAAKGGVSASSSNTSIGSGSSYSSNRRPTNTPSHTISHPIPTPGMPSGLPPPPPGMPGLRPPGMLGTDGNGLGLMGAAPPLPPPNVLPVMPPGMPPGFPPLNLMGRPPMMPGVPPVPHGILGGALEQIKAAGNATHLNPAFLQEMAAQNAHQGSMQKMAELFDRFRQQSVPASRMGGGMDSRRGHHQHLSDEEITDTNQRNKAISSSAINRALSDANGGDYESAADMLRMACTLIKQSVTSNSETSQILIQSLQDCLHGIEEQATVTRRSSSRREHHSHDDRERNRGSHRSAKHHRDRSRERRR